MATRLLNIRSVIELTSLSRTTIYRLMARARFPNSVRLGGRVAWLEAEVEAWVLDRIAAHRGVAAA